MKRRDVVLRRGLRWLVIACLLSFARPASAYHWSLYDLASLAIQSDAVVQVQMSASQDGAKATRFDVTKVYAGSAKVGDVLDASAYRADAEGPIVLFLEKPGAPGEPRRLVDAGMRIVVDGHVQRFVIGGRLGQDWVTVPQNRDPLEPTSTAPPGVDFATFEGDLVEAVARAARARTLFADPNADERAIVDLVALPELERPVISRRYRDEIATGALKKLATEGKVDALVDAYLVLPQRISLGDLGRVQPEPLLAMVRDGRIAPRRRGAAVRALSGHGGPVDLRLLEELLAHPELDVRRAAARGALWDVERDGPLQSLLSKRFREETDEPVRYQIVQLMSLILRFQPIPGWSGPEPLVAIEREGRQVTADWISLTNKRWEASELEVSVTKDGAPLTVVKVTAAPAASAGQSKVRASDLVLSRDTFTQPGHYELTAELELEDGDARTSRKQVLPPIDITMAPPVPAPSTSAPLPALSSAASASPDASTESGCACRAASAPSHGSAIHRAWALALIGAAYARRRRRAQPARPVV